MAALHPLAPRHYLEKAVVGADVDAPAGAQDDGLTGTTYPWIDDRHDDRARRDVAAIGVHEIGAGLNRKIRQIVEEVDDRDPRRILCKPQAHLTHIRVGRPEIG
jgi:hypothetical protein